jgi:hypothetical protein
MSIKNMKMFWQEVPKPPHFLVLKIGRKKEPLRKGVVG